jgi:hypothetical protein
MKVTLSTTVIVAAIAIAVGAPGAYAKEQVGGSVVGVNVADPTYPHPNELRTANDTRLTAPAVAYVRANEDAASASAAASDAEDAPGRVDWMQVAIGFGVGLVLALGLVLIVRMRPRQPIAQ